MKNIDDKINKFNGFFVKVGPDLAGKKSRTQWHRMIMNDNWIIHYDWRTTIIKPIEEDIDDECKTDYNVLDMEIVKMAVPNH